jgi:hypothetical protein
MKADRLPTNFLASGGAPTAWRVTMTKKLFHDPEHWFERAEDARRIALEILDPLSRRTMLEGLARRAAERLQEATGGDRRGDNSFERTAGGLSPEHHRTDTATRRRPDESTAWSEARTISAVREPPLNANHHGEAP